MQRAASFAFLFFIFASFAKAEDYNLTQLQAVADSFIAELKKAGAKNVSTGKLSYESSTKTLQIEKLTAEFPETVTETKTISEKSSIETKTKREAVILTIARISAANLSYNSTSWLADMLRIEGINAAIKDKPGVMAIAALEFKSIESPRMDAPQLAKELGEGTITLVQDSSFASAVMSGLTFLAKDTDKDVQQISFKMGNLVFDDVVKGKAGRLTLAPSTLTSDFKVDDVADEDGKTISKPGKITLNKKQNEDSAKSFTMTIKPSEARDFDIGLYADFFRSKPRRAGQKDLPLYASASFEGLNIDAGDTFTFNMKPVTTANARMNVPQNGVMALLGTMGAEKLSKENEEKLYSLYRDWMSLTVIGELTSQGADFRSKEASFSIASIQGKELGATIGDLSANNFDLKSTELNAKFDSMNLRKIDTTTFSNAMMEEMQRNAEAPNYANLEGKLPTFGLVEFNGVTLQSKGEDALLVSRIGFELDSWVRFVPQRFRAAIEKAVIPANALKDIGKPDLHDLGYKQLITGSELQFKLDKTAKTAVLAPAKIDLGEAGSITGSINLANIEESMLGASVLGEDISKLAEARFEKFGFEIVNGNFLERFINWRSKISGTSKDEIQAEIGQMFKSSIAFIADETQRKKAQDAVDAFLDGAKTLSVSVTPKETMSVMDIQLGMMVNQESLSRKLNFEIIAK